MQGDRGHTGDFLCGQAPLFFTFCSEQIPRRRINQRSHRQGPRPRISEAQGNIRPGGGRGVDGPAVYHRREERADQDPRHQLGTAGHQRVLRVSDALDRRSENKQDHQHEIQGQVHIKIGISVADRGLRDLIRTHKQVLVRAVYGEKHTEAAENPIHGKADKQALYGAAADPVLPSRAQILGMEADDGRAQGVHGAHKEVIELIGGAESVLGGIAGYHDPALADVKAHKRTLHHDDADCQHRKLKAHGNALSQVPDIEGKGHMEVTFRGVELLIFPERVDQAQYRAQCLGQHGCHRRADDPEPEHKDEKQVQTDIQHGGEQQENQRRCGIPQAPQDGANQIVVKLGEYADENYQGILIGSLPDAGVCLRQADEAKQGPQGQYGDGGQQQGHSTPENELRREGSSDPGLIALPRRYGGYHRESGGAAHCKLQEYKEDRENIIYACNFIDAEGLAADGGIADGIDLLKQVRENDRYGKFENHPSFAAGKQVEGGSVSKS